MRSRVFLFAMLVILAMVVPALLMGETVYLKDGSTLKGELRKLENDTLHFATAFGAMVKIPKSEIVRIDFVSEAPVAEAELSRAADPGTLQVVFENVNFTTRINVERNKNREEVERENSIEQRLLAGNKLLHSHVDSLTDKVIRNGPDTTLRNDFEAQDIRVVLDPALHHLTLTFANTRAERYVGQFDGKPLERELHIDNIQIEPGATTRVRVGMKRKKFGVTKSELYVIK